MTLYMLICSDTCWEMEKRRSNSNLTAIVLCKICNAWVRYSLNTTNLPNIALFFSVICFCFCSSGFVCNNYFLVIVFVKCVSFRPFLNISLNMETAVGAVHMAQS